MSDKSITEIFVIIIVVLIGIGAAFRGACVDDATTKRAVEKQGYSEVKIVDKGIFAIGLRGCSGSDAAKYAVKAKNAQGNEVDLVVCVGWPFKGVTVRTE